MEKTLFNAINNILTLSIGVIGVILGICLLLLKTPQQKGLENYKTAREILAWGYIALGLSMFLELIHGPVDENGHYNQMIMLAVASLIALSFTTTFITLIEINFSIKQVVWRELLPILFFSVLTFLSYYVMPQMLHIVIFFLFSAYYISLLIRYTLLFRRSCRQYELKRDNYYAEQNAGRLSWAKRGFYYALLVGICAFVSVYVPWRFIIVFKLFIIPFYIFSAIQLISYAFEFHYHAPILLENDNYGGKFIKQSISFGNIEENLKRWVNEKKFTHSNLTIETLAEELHSNRTYLSNYINSYENKTFKEWIHSLRIEEAKKLILKNPDLPAAQIGKKVGYNDRSNFNRQFIKYTGTSPRVWKSQQKENA